MEINIDIRKKQLDSLNNFISTYESKIEHILSTLQWDRETVLKDCSRYVECPLNGEHRVLEHKLDEHLERCVWSSEGYTEDDVSLSEPSSTRSTVVVDEKLQTAIIKDALSKNATMQTRLSKTDRKVPKTSDRLISEFTVDERLAIYDYVVEKAGIKAAESVDIELNLQSSEKKQSTREKSFLEILAEERNQKRRRIKYKSVHTKRKTYTETMREVIASQMEILAELMSEKNDSEPGGKDPYASDKHDEVDDDARRRNDQELKNDHQDDESKTRDQRNDTKDVKRNEEYYQKDDRRKHERFSKEKSKYDEYSSKQEYEKYRHRSRHDRSYSKHNSSRESSLSSKYYGEHKRDRHNEDRHHRSRRSHDKNDDRKKKRSRSRDRSKDHHNRRHRH